MQARLIEVSREILPQITAIDRTCLGSLWSLQAYEREIDSPDSHLLAVIDPDGVVLGFGCLWRVLEEAHITMLAVRPEFQRLGIGRYLVFGLLHVAHCQGSEWATLEVRESNHAAIALYESFAFKLVGRRRNYYRVTDEDALILWRKGLNAPEFPLTLHKWQTDIDQHLATKQLCINADRTLPKSPLQVLPLDG